MRRLRTIPTARSGRARCSSAPRGREAAARRVAVDLSPQTVERIATRVAVLLQERERGAEPRLLSAGELARRLRVERPWVYRHRHLLGGLRIGSGPKAPWRFDYETAVEALERRQAEQQSAALPQRENFRKPRHARTGR